MIEVINVEATDNSGLLLRWLPMELMMVEVVDNNDGGGGGCLLWIEWW